MGESVESIRHEVERLRSEATEALSAAGDAPALQAVQDRFLGRRSGAVNGSHNLGPAIRRADARTNRFTQFARGVCISRMRNVDPAFSTVTVIRPSFVV